MGHAQGGLEERDTPNIIRATLLYNFAKLVAWPDHKKAGDFTIAVVNSQKLTLQLTKKYSGKKVGDQALQILSPSIEEVIDSESIHIVYIPKVVQDANPDFISKLKEKNILIVTEFEKGTTFGSCINFYTNQSQIKYEYDENNAISHELKIGVTLKSLGTPVNK